MMLSGIAESPVASEKKRYLTAIAAITIAAFFWAIVEHLGACLPRGYSPVQTVWSRYLVHILFMLIFIAPQKGSDLVRTRCLGLQVTRALLMVAMPVCFIGGVLLLPIQVVWLVSWSSVMMLLLLSRWILRERVAACSWIAAGSGWLGVWAMSGVSLPPVSWRYLVPFVMGACYAIYVILTRRMNGESTQTKLFHTAVWAFLVFSLVVPFQWKMPSLKVAIIFACIGLSGYLVLFFLDKSIELAPVSLAAPLIYMVPLWSSVQDFIITGKAPETMTTVGASMILVASAAIVLGVLFGQFRFAAAE